MKFYVETTSAKSSVSELRAVEMELREAESQIRSVSGYLRTFGGYSGVRARMTGVNASMDSMLDKFARMEDGLERAVEYYLRCEMGITGQLSENQNGANVQDIAGALFGLRPFRQLWEWLKEILGIGKKGGEETGSGIGGGTNGGSSGGTDVSGGGGGGREATKDEVMAAELRALLNQARYSKAIWQNSTIEQRKQILTELFADMRTVFGIQVEKIDVEPIESEKGYITWGYLSYMRPSGRMQITINESQLTNPKYYDAIMNTMVHELRHGYQHSVVDHPENYEVSEEIVKAWRDNFNNYKTTARDGYDAYRNQPVEADARAFADMVHKK